MCLFICSTFYLFSLFKKKRRNNAVRTCVKKVLFNSILYRETERINNFIRFKQFEPKSCHLNITFRRNINTILRTEIFSSYHLEKIPFPIFWVKVRRLENDRGFVRSSKIPKNHYGTVNGRLEPLSIYFGFVMSLVDDSRVFHQISFCLIHPLIYEIINSTELSTCGEMFSKRVNLCNSVSFEIAV